MSEQSLSICMVTTFYPPYHFGGDALYVYRLSNALARRGHGVTVVHSVDAYRILRHEEPRDAFPHQPGVTVVPLRSRLGPVSPLVTYLSGRPGPKAGALSEVFREHFDVVHFHNVSLVGGPAVLAYGDGIKLYTMHEHWLVCPMHVLWKNNREPCVEPQCLRCTLAFRRPPQLWRYGGLLERQLGHVDLFLAPSRFTIEAHRQRGFSRPIHRLPFFVPPAEGKPSAAAPSVQAPRPYFLYVGRLEKIKGVDVLLERFRDYGDADLTIVGDGTQAEGLRRRAEGLPGVRFLGRVHPATLSGLYTGAIALIVPSVGYEVFGLVVLEAFARRTPVIVHDLGALPELVEESGGGLVYRTPDELLRAMESLRADPELRRELGQRGYKTWLRRYTEGAHLRGYFAAIDEARRGGGR